MGCLRAAGIASISATHDWFADTVDLGALRDWRPTRISRLQHRRAVADTHAGAAKYEWLSLSAWVSIQ